MGTGTAALTRISMNESKVERDEDRRKKGFELKEYQISAVLAQAKSWLRTLTVPGPGYWTITVVQKFVQVKDEVRDEGYDRSDEGV